MQVISMEERNVVVSKSSSDGGIYLTFAVSGREYGIELLKIRKIIGITTPVPTVQRFIKTNAFPLYFDPAGILSSIPHYVKGILRLHGKIIPIIDLGL